MSKVDGYIGKLHVHTVGAVITPAEKVITIIPKDAPLIIKATLLNQDSGFVKKGMEVSVKIDTFDFQKYGMIHGIVTHKSDDSIDDEIHPRGWISTFDIIKNKYIGVGWYC